MSTSFRPARSVLRITCAAALTVGLAGVGAPAFATAPTPGAVVQEIVSAQEAGEVTLTPAQGGVTDRTVVAISGDDLDGVVEVRFGARPATILPGGPDGELRVQAPTAAKVNAELPYQAQSVPVTLVTAEGVTVPAGAFEYTVTTDVDRQLAYTLKHWQKYHIHRYGSFARAGGDGANFASQTLAARGFQPDDVWHNDFDSETDSIDNWQEWTTAAWISSTALNSYLETKRDQYGLSTIDVRSTERRAELGLGDLVFFNFGDSTSDAVAEIDGSVRDASAFADASDELTALMKGGEYDHVMIVSDLITNPDGTISVHLAGHTNDRDFHDLDRVLADGAVTGQFWHLGG